MLRKYYRLKSPFPIYSQALHHLGFDEQDQVSKWDQLRQVEKAKTYGYTHLLTIEENLPTAVLDAAKESNIQIELMVIANKELIDSDLFYRAGIILFLEEDQNLLEELVKSDSSKKFLFFISKRQSFIRSLKLLKDLGGIGHAFFPTKEKLDDNYLSTRQINKLIKNNPLLKFDPLPGLTPFDYRAPKDIELCPLISPLFEKLENKNVEDSIIIPVFNQREELLKTLKNLNNLKESGFEIIIIDDGGSDALYLERELLLENLRNVDFRFLRIPRVYPRKMGDGRFRAGIARNLGCLYARGSRIHFLDADVLVPENYLSQLRIDLENYDLVQIKRFDLKEEASKRIELCSEANEDDIEREGRDYWYNFFKTRDWNVLKNKWKYVCTYGLSCQKKHLDELGGISPFYLFYGFEDTDLGYKFHQAKKKFLLSDVVSYHQYHRNTRSEFKNSNYHRAKLLSNTGQIFYLRFLQPEIYNELIDFIRPSYNPLQIFKYPFSILVSLFKRERA